MIRRRGENLSPAEVEAALERHPDVAEAAVIGVPSDLSEEDVKAFVVAAPGAHRRRRRSSTRSRASSSPRSRCRATSRSSTTFRTRPTGRLAKHHASRRPHAVRGGLRSHPLTEARRPCTSPAVDLPHWWPTIQNPVNGRPPRVAWVFIQRLLAHPTRTGSVHACSTHRRGGSTRCVLIRPTSTRA